MNNMDRLGNLDNGLSVLDWMILKMHLFDIKNKTLSWTYTQFVSNSSETLKYITHLSFIWAVMSCS